jgi:type VI secretion system protein ImpM
MAYPTGAGFFGKLPNAGDFVQRRLPPSFVEVWDRHFEHAVDASRQALGQGWQHAYRSSPAWRFVLPPGVCTPSAWIGVMGPAGDRVGRHFPMVIAAPWDDLSSIAQVLQRGDTWFAAIERVYAAAQADASIGVDAFDAQLLALADRAVVSPEASALDEMRNVAWSSAEQWRLPLPQAHADGAYLAELWTRVAENGNNWCLWWTHGAGHVPASVLVTRGLPQPSAYTGFLDAAHAAGAWQSLGVFDDAASHLHAHATTQAHAQAPAHVAMAAHVAMTDAAGAPVSRQLLPDDMSEFFADLAAPASMGMAPASIDHAGMADATSTAAVVHRHDVALALVAANEGEHDPRRRAAADAVDVANNVSAADLAAGSHILRARLLALHPRLRESGEDLINPLPEDGSVIAVRITGRWADLLRIGTAAAWHWRQGQLQSLFATGAAVPAGDAPALAGEFDDLLFTRAAPVASGLGGATEPLCDEVVCAVEPGDRLLLVATQKLVQLAPDIYARALAMPACEDARARIAAAAGLAQEPSRWPLAVIEVTS